MPLRLLLPICAALLAACQARPSVDGKVSILPQPVSRYENLPLSAFRGWREVADPSKP